MTPAARQLVVEVAPTGVIMGQRVVLQPFRWSDVPRYMTWIQEEQAKKFFNPFLTSEDPRWLLTLWFKPATDILGIWGPEGRDGRLRHIGGIGFQHVDYKKGEAEFGFLIGRPEWRDKGYGTDALNALKRHAFNTLGLKSIYAKVVADNERSIKVLKRNDFVLEGEGKPIKIPGHGESPVLIFRLNRSDI